MTQVGIFIVNLLFPLVGNLSIIEHKDALHHTPLMDYFNNSF